MTPTTIVAVAAPSPINPDQEPGRIPEDALIIQQYDYKQASTERDCRERLERERERD